MQNLNNERNLIATRPQSGRFIVGWYNRKRNGEFLGFEQRIVLAREGKLLGEDGYEIDWATHWMPLAKPPEQKDYTPMCELELANG